MATSCNCVKVSQAHLYRADIITACFMHSIVYMCLGIRQYVLLGIICWRHHILCRNQKGAFAPYSSKILVFFITNCLSILTYLVLTWKTESIMYERWTRTIAWKRAVKLLCTHQRGGVSFWGCVKLLILPSHLSSNKCCMTLYIRHNPRWSHS